MFRGGQAGGHARRRVQFNAMALAVVEGERVAVIAFAAGQRQAGRGVEASAQQTDGAHFFGSFNANRNPISGNAISPANACCIESTSETQPVSGMKTRPAAP